MTATLAASEADLDGVGVAEFRLGLAAALLGWSPTRIGAYRQGYHDGALGRVDMERADGHGLDDGHVEATLSPRQVDALGYQEGAEAGRDACHSTLTLDWDPGKARLVALCWGDQADDRNRAEAAEWSTEMDGDTGRFLRIMSRGQWVTWFVREHHESLVDGRSGYADLLTQDIREPVVFVEDGDFLDVLDGWHRIGACMVRGSATIPMLKGIAPTPMPMP